MPKSYFKKRGFTLNEIIMVVAIITILVAIVLPNFLRARHNTNELLAIKGLRALSDALEMYKSDYKDYPDSIPVILNTTPPYISNPTLVNATTSAQQSYRGYRFDYTKTGIRQYKYIASPAVTGVTGTRQFIVTESGEVTDYTPPPPLSCPYLYVWDGSNYIKDNDILPMADISSLGEYTDYYLLSKIPVTKNDRFFLKLVEEMSEVSYLDKISFIIIEHPLDTQIAPDPQGNIWTIQNPILPVSAMDTKEQNHLTQIQQRGDDFYKFDKGSWLIIHFGKVESENGARLVLSADVARPSSVHVQVLNKQNHWQDVNVIHPHEYWDIWAVDLSKFLSNEDEDFKIRLYCTASHKIDYVALDISKQQPITKTELPIMRINSSLPSENFQNIFNSDNQYLVMNTGDYLELEFPCYSQAKVKRDFLLISEGYYMLKTNTGQGGQNAQ